MIDGTPPPTEEVEALSGLPDPKSVDGPLQSREQLFDLLSDRRCMYALWYLYRSSEGTAGLDELVDSITDWERATTDHVPDEHERKVELSLHHFDIPKLMERGIVDYDERTETVSYAGDPALESCFESLSASG